MEMKLNLFIKIIFGNLQICHTIARPSQYIMGLLNQNPTKLKAWIFAKGFQQQQGQDFEKTYALVTKHNILHTLYVIASTQIDPFSHGCQNNLLNDKIKEDDYI